MDWRRSSTLICTTNEWSVRDSPTSSRQTVFVCFVTVHVCIEGGAPGLAGCQISCAVAHSYVALCCRGPDLMLEMTKAANEFRFLQGTGAVKQSSRLTMLAGLQVVAKQCR